MATVAEMREAKPKFTDNVMVQFPMSHIQPVMNDKAVLLVLAIWKDQ